MENLTVTNNGSEKNETHLRLSLDIAYYCYYYGIFLLITLVNFCGNSLILVSARRRNLRTPENYFIFSLAVSDILYGMVYTLYNIGKMEVQAVKVITSKWFCIAKLYGILYFTLYLMEQKGTLS